eukprot:Skav222285  [mRNA]  locus=scaffold807:261919:262893:+ [translate_table: standard]
MARWLRSGYLLTRAAAEAGRGRERWRTWLSLAGRPRRSLSSPWGLSFSWDQHFRSGKEDFLARLSTS